MKRRSRRGQLVWLAAAFVAVSGGTIWAQKPAPGNHSAKAISKGAATMADAAGGAATGPGSVPAAELDRKTAPTRSDRLRGRLPAHFGQVVDEKQRQAIYAIQEEYAGKIEELKNKLEAVIKERDSKITAVLTAQQREKIESLRAAGKEKKQGKPAEN